MTEMELLQNEILNLTSRITELEGLKPRYTFERVIIKYEEVKFRPYEENYYFSFDYSDKKWAIAIKVYSKIPGVKYYTRETADSILAELHRHNVTL